MRTIRKGAEPRSLTEHRLSEHADYDNYADKESLRKSLVQEQRGLCCYCQSRIKPMISNMKIEHWKSQSGFPGMQLDYRNLLGACMGGHGKQEHETHCDTSKGNRELCFSVNDPLHPIEKEVRFLGDGTVSSKNANVNSAINSVLNLNLPKLVNNRRAVLAAFQSRLEDGRPLDPSREMLRWDGTNAGDLPEFSQVVVYWLQKKIGIAK